jgi:hypothetical protein
MNKITFATLPEATPQQVFNQVAEHLMKQARPSKQLDGGKEYCAYRATVEDGTVLKCAAGCLIGDDEYSPDMEGFTWRKMVQKGKIPSDHLRLIMDLQNVHDCNITVDWKRKLQIVAAGRSLSIPEVIR